MTPASAVGGLVGRISIVSLSLLAVISGLLLIGTFSDASLQLQYSLADAGDDAVATSDPVKAASGKLDTESSVFTHSEISISSSPVSDAAPAQQRKSSRCSVEFRWTFETEVCRTCYDHVLDCVQDVNCHRPRPVSAACLRRPTLVTLGIRLQA